MPLRIHRGTVFVSGEAWRLFKEAHPEQDFLDFWLEASLKFSIGCFDLSSFFLLRKDKNPTTASSCPLQIPKTEPLSPITSGLDFAYASDIVEDSNREPGHIIELSF
jgi:hypothetical protein